jgi:hypothetical protein
VGTCRNRENGLNGRRRNQDEEERTKRTVLDALPEEHVAERVKGHLGMKR